MKIFKGSTDIPEDMFTKTFNRLSEAVSTGYGTTGYDALDAEVVWHLKNNVAVFSAFKSNSFATAMHSLLVNDEGTKRSWPDFLKEAKKVDPKYNQLWLEAEYNLATKQARSAQQWQDYQRDKETYPNLEYIGSSAANPREAHKQYYGTIRPLDDPFWDTAMPPVGFGCACSTRQSRKEPTAKAVKAPEPVAGIAGNAGKSRQIFSASSHYVSELSKEEKQNVRAQLNKLREKNQEVITMMVGKAAVTIHVNADPNDLKNNLAFATEVTRKYKKDFGINAHTHEPGKKNPEFTYRNIPGDRTEWKDAKDVNSYLKNSFRDKMRKDGQLQGYDKAFIGMDFMGKLTESNYFDMFRRLNGNLKNQKKVQFVILKNGDKTLIIDRDIPDFSTTLLQIKKELL